jgi:flagellar capping protein FliD
MQILMNEGVIVSTAEGKLYIDEEKLDEFHRKRM